MDEIFLEDEETGLLVSNLGRVVGPRKELKPSQGQYLRVMYTKHKARKFVSVHRLVARNFLPNPLNLPAINHKDENPHNNRVDNLEWCTIKYNNSYGTLQKRAHETVTRLGLSKARKKVTLEKDGCIKTFNSICEAAKEIGAGLGSIWAITQGRMKSAKGWHIPGAFGYGSPEPKPLRLVKDGIVKEFKSVYAASVFLKSSGSNVRLVRDGKNHHIKGWRLAQ